MLVSTYHLTDTERVHARRQWLDGSSVLVGRAADCDVVVDDPEVAAHHLRLSSRDGQILAENLVDELTALVDEGDGIRIGNTIVKVRLQAQPVVTTGPTIAPPPRLAINPPMPTSNPPPPPPPQSRARPRVPVLSDDPQEQALLAAIRAKPADPDARMVYADWLEGHGKKAQAGLVRLREHLGTYLYRKATTVEWRAVAARTPIDQCSLAHCPGAWDALVPNEVTDFVRNCATCRKDVRYCAEANDVRGSGYAGAPVVFDASLDRGTALDWYANWGKPVDDDE